MLPGVVAVEGEAWRLVGWGGVGWCGVVWCRLHRRGAPNTRVAPAAKIRSGGRALCAAPARELPAPLQPSSGQPSCCPPARRLGLRQIHPAPPVCASPPATCCVGYRLPAAACPPPRVGRPAGRLDTRHSISTRHSTVHSCPRARSMCWALSLVSNHSAHAIIALHASSLSGPCKPIVRRPLLLSAAARLAILPSRRVALRRVAVRPVSRASILRAMATAQPVCRASRVTALPPQRERPPPPPRCLRRAHTARTRPPARPSGPRCKVAPGAGTTAAGRDGPSARCLRAK